MKGSTPGLSGSDWRSDCAAHVSLSLGRVGTACEYEAAGDTENASTGQVRKMGACRGCAAPALSILRLAKIGVSS